MESNMQSFRIGFMMWGLAGLLILCPGCSSDGGGSPTGNSGQDPGTETRTIDSAGGEFDFFGGQLRLKFWPGTIPDGTEVEISSITPPLAQEDLQNGTCFQVGPDDLSWSTAVGLFLGLPSGARASELAGNKIHRYTDGAWSPVATAVVDELLLTWIPGPGIYVLKEMVAGPVHVGNFTLYDDSQLPALVGYEGITGSLSISGDDLTRIEGFESLRWIGGDLYITACPQLDLLENLESIARVDGKLEISATALSSIGALSGLAAVNGHVIIEWNENLNGLAGLENIESVGGSVHVQYNGALQSVSGLGGLSDVGREIKIANNGLLSSLAGIQPNRAQAIQIVSCPELTSLSGLIVPPFCDGLLVRDCDSLESLNGIVFPFDLGAITVEHCSGLISLQGLGTLTTSQRVTIANNLNLLSLSGLQNLESVQGLLELDSNPALAGLAGLSGLRSVGGLKIVDCDALVDLSDLSQLSRLGWFGFETTSYLDISYNDLLSDITGLHGLLVNPGTGFAIPENIYCRHNLLIGMAHVEMLVEALGGIGVIGGEIILQ